MFQNFGERESVRKLIVICGKICNEKEEKYYIVRVLLLMETKTEHCRSEEKENKSLDTKSDL